MRDYAKLYSNDLNTLSKMGDYGAKKEIIHRFIKREVEAEMFESRSGKQYFLSPQQAGSVMDILEFWGWEEVLYENHQFFTDDKNLDFAPGSAYITNNGWANVEEWAAYFQQGFEKTQETPSFVNQKNYELAVMFEEHTERAMQIVLGKRPL